ncbi:sulfite exporter TauE/SafE family protein [Oceanicella sp. SM1341]|uniref:sulfite exporter TauE/SafE family protein n=1 Tax=Oceanicella sp. SM1341 TaxID=1548889 RepID=UPI000E47CD26|nr:sulfite exporter TauE/SafE family protein [Oceanicella sp. SM1341]
MQFDWLFFAMTIPAVIFAGVSKGGFGAGAGFAATPFLALILPPHVAVGLMLPLLMVMDVTSLRVYWRKWDWRNARAIMAGAVPGVLLGMLLFNWANPDVIRLVIGLTAVGFVAFQLARARGLISSAPRPFRLASAGFWGMASGFTSFVSHAGGPPAAIHLLGQQLDKRTYQATTVLIFWWINLIKLPPFLALDIITSRSLLADLILAPVAILATLLGAWAHNHVPEKPYFAAVYVCLVITGGKLIFDGLT